MNLFGLTISKTPEDLALRPGEVALYAVVHPDGRFAYFHQTRTAAEDLIRHSAPEGLRIIRLAARELPES